MKRLIMILACTSLLAITQTASTSNSSGIAKTQKMNVSTVLPDTTKIVAAEAAAAPAMVQLEAEPKPIEITISFLGDCLLATLYGYSNTDSFNDTAQNVEAEYFFEGVIDIIGNDDFTIANAENVFTDKPLKESYKGYSPAYWFKSPSKNAEIYAKNSIDLVSLANNHTYDYGVEGYHDTIAAVEAAMVDWTDETRPVVLEKDGIKIAVISLVLYRYEDYEKTFEQIAEYKNKADAIIVFFHGGTERLHIPEEFKENAARAFIDAGATCVIGSHPHVLQPFEEHNGGHILYSLGNFCYGSSAHPENRTIIFQETLTFDSDGNFISMQENIVPCYVYTGLSNNYQPFIIEDEKIKNEVLDFMYQRSGTLFP